ncbi:unnamed protein product [Amoebophrya sp. A25]|nr:unnamed protein product [Amoebophrya sp. A25]|eukprot:GSA25T00009707001.1
MKEEVVFNKSGMLNKEALMSCAPRSCADAPDIHLASRKVLEVEEERKGPEQQISQQHHKQQMLKDKLMFKELMFKDLGGGEQQMTATRPGRGLLRSSQSSPVLCRAPSPDLPPLFGELLPEAGGSRTTSPIGIDPLTGGTAFSDQLAGAVHGTDQSTAPRGEFVLPKPCMKRSSTMMFPLVRDDDDSLATSSSLFLRTRDRSRSGVELKELEGVSSRHDHEGARGDARGGSYQERRNPGSSPSGKKHFTTAGDSCSNQGDLEAQSSSLGPHRGGNRGNVEHDHQEGLLGPHHILQQSGGIEKQMRADLRGALAAAANLLGCGGGACAAEQPPRPRRFRHLSP